MSRNWTEQGRTLPTGVAEPAPPPTRGRHSGRLSLEWSGDTLELHCWIIRESTVVGHVCGRESRIDRADANIVLSADTSSEGVETISWTTTPDLSLEFAVRAVAPAWPSFAGARIDARINDHVLFFEPPAAEDGRWWRLFVVPSGRSPVRLVNEIGSQPPYTE